VNDQMMCRISGGVEQAKQLRILDFEFGFWECMSRIEKRVKFFWRWKCNLHFSLYYWWVYGRNAHTKCFWTEPPPISFHFSWKLEFGDYLGLMQKHGKSTR
jgi:hypothetical protein